MSDYTPSEARVCIDYCNAATKRSAPDGSFMSMEEADEAFSRFLDAFKRDTEIALLERLAGESAERWKAWSVGIESTTPGEITVSPRGFATYGQAFADMLRAKANELRKEQTDGTN